MPNLTTVTLPAGLTGIPKDAFANSAQLATVNFKAADANTPSAKDGEANAITLPTGITTIDANAFAGTAATTMDLSKVTGLTMIDASVFQNMTKLATVTLPSGLTTINQSAFQNDAALKKLTQSNPSQAREENDATPAEGTAKFGSKLTSIGNNAFYGTGFTTVDLSLAGGTQASAPSSGRAAAAAAATPNPLTVGSGAFTNMADLTTVKLPANSNIDPANFGNPADATGTPKLQTIQYGTDSTTTTPATATISNATISSTNFSKITNKTIEIKSSVGNSGITFTGGVFFGNTNLQTLKLSVTQTNGNAPL